MIKLDIKMRTKAALMQAGMAEVEKRIAREATGAAARYGGVAVRFSRNPDGSIRTIEFHGSEAAIAAARAAIGNQTRR